MLNLFEKKVDISKSKNNGQYVMTVSDISLDCNCFPKYVCEYVVLDIHDDIDSSEILFRG